ncbi:MAG: hypothetical protein JXB88_10020 [Spirochaetales bacterium]|nr:hypothetical protein [Spirochaetales bacterium]
MTEYIQCRICKYWVLNNDKYCPHCGILHPYKEKSPLLSIKFPGFIIAGHVCVYGIVELFTKYTIQLPRLFISMGGFSLLSVLSGLLIDIRLKKRLTRSKKYLLKDEENIHIRIKDIKERIEKIKQIRKKLTDREKTDKSSTLVKILDDTGNFFDDYLMKYSGELWKIELIRWKNILEPLEFTWKTDDYDTLEKHLEVLKQTKDIGVKLEKKWAKDPYSDTQKGIMILGNLRELIEGCEKFYKAILARQAKLVIKDVSPIDDKAHELRSARDPGGYSEIFNSKKDLLTFFSSFEELEREFDRLEAEKELISE